MSETYQHPDLQRLSVRPDGHDFELYTDGSGYKNDYGGSAAVVFSLRYGKYATRAAAYHGISTERAEFEALLSGLQAILEITDSMSHGRLEFLRAHPYTVFWLSDRESLVGSVLRQPLRTGPPVYGRKASADLWCRFEWYEQFLTIDAVHRPRNQNPYQSMTDRVSSECRVLMRDYHEVLRANKEF